MIHAITGIAIAFVGLGLIALLLSKNAQTGSLFGSLGTSFSNVLGCALSPITGKKCATSGSTPSVSTSISYPGFGG